MKNAINIKLKQEINENNFGTWKMLTNHFRNDFAYERNLNKKYRKMSNSVVEFEITWDGWLSWILWK